MYDQKCEKCSKTCCERVECCACPCTNLCVMFMGGESEPTGQIGDAFTMHCFAFMCCWIPDLIFCIPGTVVGTVVGSIEGFLQCCKNER